MQDTPLTSATLYRHMRRLLHQLSTPVLYSTLLMFYAFRRHDTPAWAKRIVTGAFIYLITPIDAIPDLAPLLGYTDDLGVLTYALVLISAYINPEIRAHARQTLTTWTGTPDEKALAKIDRML